jgi:hypothetical protein
MICWQTCAVAFWTAAVSPLPAWSQIDSSLDLSAAVSVGAAATLDLHEAIAASNSLLSAGLAASAALIWAGVSPAGLVVAGVVVAGVVVAGVVVVGGVVVLGVVVVAVVAAGGVVTVTVFELPQAASTPAAAQTAASNPSLLVIASP